MDGGMGRRAGGGSASWLVKCAVGMLAAIACKQKTAADADTIAQTFSSNIQGKTFVVTGGSSGIGEETARVLAKHGSEVIIASHDASRGQSAADRINAAPSTRGVAEFRQLDLASFDSIDRFVSNYTKPLHGLILNAGLFAPSFGYSRDGVEQVLQVNHLGHQHLATGLTDALVSSQPSRVVVVSSWWSAKFAPELVQPFTAETYPLQGFQSYGLAKLANVRFAREFGRRLSADNDVYGITTSSVHPGLIHTNLGTARGNSVAAKLERFAAAIFWSLMWPFTRSVQQGASTQVYCAVADDAAAHSGRFYDSSQLVDFPSEAAADPSLDRELWERSQRLIDEARAGRFRHRLTETLRLPV